MINPDQKISSASRIPSNQNNEIEEEKQKQLIELSKLANKVENNKEKPFYEMTLQEITYQLLNIWNQILHELIDLFEREDEHDWVEPMKIFPKISEILLKKDRIIYVGIMLIILSFFLYFIFVTS